jgi:hypothetical protein
LRKNFAFECNCTRCHGEALQVEAMKSKLEAPKTKRSKLK